MSGNNYTYLVLEEEEPRIGESIFRIAQNLEFIDKSYTEYSGYYDYNNNNMTHLEEISAEEFFDINTNSMPFFSSNKKSSSINSQNFEERIYYTKTNEKTTKEKVKIFSIKKIQKGRKKTYAIKEKKMHTKYSQDNIVSKVKTCFVNSLKDYINQKYSDFKKNNNIKLLQKMSPNFSKAYSKKDNQEFLRLDVKQFVSMEVSKRCKASPDYNKKQIEKLYEQKEATELIEFLDLKIVHVFEKYAKNEIKEFSLEKDLKKLQGKVDNDYINKFKEKAEKLIKILSKKGKIKNRKFICKRYKPGKKKKKKNNDLSEFRDDSKLEYFN
jgi:hypothetical protein